MSPNITRSVLLILLFWIAVASAAQSQTDHNNLGPDCGGAFQMCGFKDFRTKTLIIPRRYEVADQFSQGLAAVRMKGLYGFINEKGETIIEPRFDLAGRFYQDLAEVVVGDKAGVINRQGVTIVEPQFANAHPLTKDVILARSGDRESLGTEDSDWGLYHIRRGWLTKREFLFSVFDDEGRGLVWAKPNAIGLFGLLRSDGTWQIEPRYSSVEQLIYGRAIVGKLTSGAKTILGASELRGAVDRNGKLTVPLKFDRIKFGNVGFAVVDTGDKAGLIDNLGKRIGSRWFAEAELMEAGTIATVTLGRKRVGITRKGRIVASPDDGTTLSACSSDVTIIRSHGRMKVVDRSFNATVPYPLDEFYEKPGCTAPTAVRVRGKWSIIDTNGHLLIDPPNLEGMPLFFNGHAVVRQNNKWGIIDATGQMTVAPRFDSLIRTENGLYQAIIADKTTWINATGDEKSTPPQPPVHDWIDRTSILKCPGGNKIIERGGQWGIASAEGQEIVKPQFRAIQCYQKGIAWAAIDAKRQWCPVDPDGRIRELPRCVQVRWPWLNRNFTFAKKMDADPFEDSVLHTRALLEYGTGVRSQPPLMMQWGWTTF